MARVIAYSYRGCGGKQKLSIPKSPIFSLIQAQLSNGERLQILRMKSTTNYQDSPGPWVSLRSTNAWHNLLDTPEKQRILALRESNQDFFLTLSDFIKTFTNLEIVHLDADTARDEPSLNGKNPWTLRLYHGRWQKGVSAGGCRNNPDTFHMNPQLSITLEEPDEVLLALNQHTATDPKVG